MKEIFQEIQNDMDEFLDETEADYLEMKAEMAFGI